MKTALLSSQLRNMLDSSKAMELENKALGEHSNDIADAFRAITSMVVE